MTTQHYTAIADTKREQRQRELEQKPPRPWNKVVETVSRFNNHAITCDACFAYRYYALSEPKPELKLCEQGQSILMDLFQ